MGPVPPKLVRLAQWPLRRIDALALRAAYAIRVEHAALAGTPAVRQMLPGGALGNGRPATLELTETRGQRGTPGRMVPDHFPGSPPLREGLTKDLQQPRAILSFVTARAADGPTLALKEQDAREPLALDLPQRPASDNPALLGRRRLPGACVRVREPGLLGRVGMGLCIQGDPRPHRRVAIALAQRLQRHLHALGPQQRVVIAELEDVHHGLDRAPGGDGRLLAGPCRQARQAEGGKPALPVIDHRGLDRQEVRDPPRAQANLPECHNAPAGLLCGRIFPIGPKAHEEMGGPSGLGQALRVGRRLEWQGELLACRKRR
jgi:hypothetical protein